MQTRSNTYSVGETVYGAIDGCPGTVVAVGQHTFEVEWRGEKFSVVYPEDTIMIRKAFPWEKA